MSELPKGWVETTLGNVAKWSSGGTPSRKNTAYYNGDVPWIKTGDLGVRYLEEASENISNEGLKNSSAKLFPKNSVAIAMYGATIGKTSILNIEAATNQACGVAIPNASLSSIFLYYLLKNEKEGFIARGKGGAQPNISQTIIKEYPIWLPPLNEQIRITNKLDSILAKVDKAQARLNKMPTILKRFRQSVLTAATSGELTKEWRGGKNIETWTFPKIKEVGKVQLGRQRSPKYHSGENMRPYLRVQNVFENLIDISDVMEMNFSEEDFQRYQLHNGDILLNEGQSPKFLGRPAIYRDELEGACFTNTLIRFQANELTIPEFALIVFRNHMHSGRYIEEGTITTNLAHLGAGRFSNVEFPLPPISEQEQIVHSAEKMLNKADKVEQQYLNAKARLDRLTQSILAKAFRGELVPQDPNDEPAEQLLERILKERLSQQQKADKPKKIAKKRTTKAKVADKG